MINVDLEGFSVVEVQKNRKSVMINNKYIPKEALEGGNSKQKGLKIIGWNARSIVTQGNIIRTKLALTEENIDFLLVNECGVIKKQFNDLKSHKVICKSNKVAIFYRSDY